MPQGMIIFQGGKVANVDGIKDALIKKAGLTQQISQALVIVRSGESELGCAVRGRDHKILTVSFRFLLSIDMTD